MKIQFGILILLAVSFSFQSLAICAEKKAPAEVVIDDLTGETQITVSQEQDDFNLIWVIPAEFWEASLAKDKRVPELERRRLMRVLRDHLIIGVIRADITPLGGFRFHDEKSVLDTLKVDYTAPAAKSLSLNPKQRVTGEAQAIIDAMKPILKAAMGNMGDNFHLFVCSNSAEEGERISAYNEGTISVQLAELGKNSGGKGEIVFPLDSLHVPRACTKCGKQAHISWKFCPWCGTAHSK